jgi:hypothetical protein
MKFVAEQILINLVKISGRNPFPAKDKDVNHQCVKLTKDHEAVGPMIVYWCSLNINRLQRKYGTGNTNRENKAIDLRREADQNCRNRSDALMNYTEECIARFEKNGY